MAPGADLYALKVFGCDGSTDVTMQAIEWALDPNGDGDPSDHLDVVNLSLGSDYGLADDADSMAIDRAMELGMLAVLAAGNAGDSYDIGGSPGNARARHRRRGEQRRLRRLRRLAGHLARRPARRHPPGPALGGLQRHRRERGDQARRDR